MHTTIEEEIFIHLCGKALDDAGMMNEAIEEHHVAKLPNNPSCPLYVRGRKLRTA